MIIIKELNIYICESCNKRRERERIMSRQIFDIITDQQQYMYKYRCGVLEIFKNNYFFLKLKEKERERERKLYL
jgi:transcription termination factor Rho